MNSYYNEKIDAGYVKLTDNKIVKTEPINKNISLKVYQRCILGWLATI